MAIDPLTESILNRRRTGIDEKKTVFLFSGQGSQYAEMGKELFQQDRIFRRWMLSLDELARVDIGPSVLSLLYEQPDPQSGASNRTLYTHPAIFMVEYALARTLMERGIVPDLVVGSSLGAFTAVALAGLVSVEDALRLVIKQALLLEAHCQPGRMLAIIDNVSLYYRLPELTTLSELAAVNCMTHFVVAGTVEHIQQIKQILTIRGILCEILSVSYAFHSSLINAAEVSFKQALADVRYQTPQLCYFSSLFRAEKTILPADYLWDVVRKPMAFARVIQALEQSGPAHYIDTGLGGTLANFLKRVVPAASLSSCFTILSPFHQDMKNMYAVLELFSRSQGAMERTENHGGISFSRTGFSTSRDGRNAL